jgi:hypothetical protein
MPYVTKQIVESLKTIITKDPGGVVYAPRQSGKTTALITVGHDYLLEFGDKVTFVCHNEPASNFLRDAYYLKYPNDPHDTMKLLFLSAKSNPTILKYATQPGIVLVDEVIDVKPTFGFTAGVSSLADGRIGPKTYLAGFEHARLPISFGQDVPKVTKEQKIEFVKKITKKQ